MGAKAFVDHGKARKRGRAAGPQREPALPRALNRAGWLAAARRVINLRHGDSAPPLDFGLAGLPARPRAMGAEHNRRVAVTALLGDERAGLDADLALAGMGISPPLRLRHAARMMGRPGTAASPAGWKSWCPGRAGLSGR